MPILPVKELQELAPALNSKAGAGLFYVLRKLFSVDKISDAYDSCSQYKGGEFAEHLLKNVGMDYHVGGEFEALKNLHDKPFITISNHPYGGIDGMILADLFTKVNKDYKIMVNRVLSKVEAFMPCCIQVDPKTNASKGVTTTNILAIKSLIEHVRSNKPLGLFPSGAVSDLKLKKKKLEDREWQEGIIKVIKKLETPVIPVRFFDHNSRFFYLLGLIDWRIRTLRLPHEIVNKRGKLCRVGIGKPILPEEMAQFQDIESLQKFLRDKIYSMEIPDNLVLRSSLE